MGVIYINGSPSTDYGIVVEAPPNRDFPARKVSRISIPGRNGDYIIDSGAYENTVREYEIAFGSFYEQNVYELANRVRAWLNKASMGSDEYYRLADSYEPEVYRLARFDEAGSFSNILNYAGRTTIRFNCKPQRFLLNGDLFTDYLPTMGGRIDNTYAEYGPSRPLVRIKGSGSALLTIGGIRININGLTNNEQIDIDCEAMQAFYNSGSSIINKNSKIELLDGEFPIIKNNAITDITLAAQLWMALTVTEFKISPRWWRL